MPAPEWPTITVTPGAAANAVVRGEGPAEVERRERGIGGTVAPR